MTNNVLKKKYFFDFLYSFSGIIIMNCLIQFYIYPFLSNNLGNEEFGTLLTLLSVVAIVAATFGSSANYSRVISHSEKKDANGDYNIFLAFSSILICIISIATWIILKRVSWNNFAFYLILMIFTNLRYYADANYRFETNYKKYCLYYLCVSIGYFLGTIIYKYYNNYFLIFILGELLALVFVTFNGTVFKKPFFKKGSFFKDNIKSTTALSISNLIEALTSNIDKLIVYLVVGANTVTTFYLSTLLGKSIALITGPLNSVIIGHIVKRRKNYKKRISANI